MPPSGVAAAVVTRDGATWIRQVLESILAQSHPVDHVVVVDDGSRDDTCGIIEREFASRVRLVRSADVRPADSRRSLYTRIAANFTQAVIECDSLNVEFVALADQDDVWHPDRIAHQRASIGSATMLASDGTLVDEAGHSRGGTLRSIFPVPAGFDAATPAQRMRWALRHSLATGSASLVRPFPLRAANALMVPPGWLHDRWWSLVTCAMDSFRVDEAAVIDYQVRADQVVGLDAGLQQTSSTGRLLGHGRDLGSSIARLSDLHARLLPLARDRSIRSELSWLRMTRTLLHG